MLEGVGGGGFVCVRKGREWERKIDGTKCGVRGGGIPQIRKQ